MGSAKSSKIAKGASRPNGPSIVEGNERLVHCGALQQLGIKVQHCLPYRPQGKNVERLFRTVHSGLDSLFATYLTGNAYNKPDAAILTGEEHRRLQKLGRGGESRMVPASSFIGIATQWMERYNAEHRHRGQGMNGRTPNEVFELGNPLPSRRSADPAVLALMLFERKEVLVRRSVVTLNRQRYVPATPQDIATLHYANDRTVTVAYDPNDPSLAYAIDPQGRPLAALQPEQLAAHPVEPCAKTSQQIKDMSRTRRLLLKSSAIAINTVHEASALGGYKTDLQALADLAKVAAPDADLISQKQIRRATRPSDKAHAPASSFDIASQVWEMLA